MTDQDYTKPAMWAYAVTYTTVENTVETADFDAAYYIADPQLKDAVAFKNDDNKIVFAVPRERLVLIEITGPADPTPAV